jgi:ectoine hydroxylase-related dioxygenase (phytanoyl-CoA dioxygenase family)
LLGPARQLIDDHIRAHGTWNGRPREPRNRVQSVGWHQDANYERDADDDVPPVLSCWVPLVSIGPDNAPLQFLIGSHRSGVLPTGPSPDTGNILIEIAADDLPDAKAVTLDDLEPGDVVLFGNRTVHRSLQNSTEDRTRWSIDVRFSADVDAQWDRDPRGYRLTAPDGTLAPEPYEVWAERHGYTAEEQIAGLGLPVAPAELDLGALAKIAGVSASDFEVF